MDGEAVDQGTAVSYGERGKKHDLWDQGGFNIYLAFVTYVSWLVRQSVSKYENNTETQIKIANEVKSRMEKRDKILKAGLDYPPGSNAPTVVIE